MHRRDFILAALASLTRPMAATGASSVTGPLRPALQELEEIERAVGGRLGVVAVDVHRGRRLAHRADERFPMCSTFKWLLAAQVLSRVDDGVERLERRIPYGPNDLLDYAPVTREHVREGAMTVSAMCAAAVQQSDNTAANLLLTTVAGPSGFTAYLRSMGDPITRLDRVEPLLGGAIPGDPRDTTTPEAMTGNLRRILLGRALSDASRRRLVDWMVGSTTGATKLRSGLPDRWRVGDKTGMGANGSTNDVAIAWPAPERPVLIAAYLTESVAPESERDGALAGVGHLVAEWIAA